VVPVIAHHRASSVLKFILRHPGEKTPKEIIGLRLPYARLAKSHVIGYDLLKAHLRGDFLPHLRVGTAATVRYRR
jgi:hypothetical protein